MTVEPSDPPAPPVDDRRYPELLAEAVARIGVHLPEWTNHNDADPGITLLQLWAYMSETLLYRSSLIPERNRQAFLRLIGYARRPAQAATGIVAFDNRRGPLSAPVLRRDVELAAGGVPFRTDTGLAVLPVEAIVYVKRRAAVADADRAEVEDEYRLLYAGFTEPGVELALYETAAVDWSVADREPLNLARTVDGCAWIALLARAGHPVEQVREALQNQVLSLGVVPYVAATAAVLPAGGADPLAAGPGLEFGLPHVAAPLPEDPAGRIATYVPVPAASTVDVTVTPGIVTLELPERARLGMWALDPTEDGVGAFPPALDGDAAERLVTWLRVRLAAQPAGTSSAATPPTARFRWIGINAAMVRQRVHVAREVLGRGTGGADQEVTLAGRPVLEDSIRLTVDGRPWTRVDDLMTAAPELAPVGGSVVRLADPVDKVAVYTLDRDTGVVRFGDGMRGRRPPAGAVIAASYDHGGGRAGLVATGAVSTGPALPAGVKVTNPLPTWGGAEPEPVELAERQVTGIVRHRDRLVTAQDYADVVHRTPGVEIARVEVLPLHDPELGDVRVPGVVTLLLLPRHDVRNPATPEPDRFFLEAVCRHLDPRRLVTTELHLRGPQYVPVWVSVGIEALPGRDLALVREEVAGALRTFLSPLHGGHPGDGWPLATAVERLEAWAVAARVGGVAKVVDVLLAGADGRAVDRVAMAGLQLPRLVAVAVRRGDPQPLAELLGTATPPAEVTVLPVPFVPVEC